jgi:hypothetical protein
MLVAAFNPCPCGYRGDPRRQCQCTAPQVEKYMGKISGPLLDRIDIHLEVPAVPFRELSASRAGTSSSQMREAVLAARIRQAERFAGLPVRSNARMTSRQIREFCPLEPAAAELVRAAVATWGSRPARTTRCSGWPARSPTSTPPSNRLCPCERGDQLPPARPRTVDLSTSTATAARHRGEPSATIRACFRPDRSTTPSPSTGPPAFRGGDCSPSR